MRELERMKITCGRRHCEAIEMHYEPAKPAENPRWHLADGREG